MTTIATDGKSMAGDGRRLTRGTIATDSAVKVFRLQDGSLFGSCGSSSWGELIRKWLDAASGGEPPKGDDGDGFMILKADGSLWQGGHDGHACEIAAPFAIGSGMDIAIGAMLAGQSAAEAVATASRKDPNTGGKTTLLPIEPASLKAVA